jgi:hypothetical protein
MVEYNIKRYIIAIIVVFIATSVSYYLFAHYFFKTTLGIWSIISTGISATAIITVLFVSCAWKWRVFRGWMVPIPNLNGKWEGKIFYIEDGEDKSRKVSVEIKQTFLYIVVHFCSKESKSLSFCGSFNIDEKRGIRQLIYSYRNDPNIIIRERSAVHFGTTKLDISPDNSVLEGEYWTSRKTIGLITLKKKR